jgi:DinB family protein
MPVAFAADLAAMLDRDLRTLQRELEAYPDERQIWQPVPGVPNTAGTLALHLAGNLQHYVGARWGGTGYLRNRDAEFARRDVPRAELIAEIERARAAVAAGLGAVRPEELDGEFPELIGGCRVRSGDFLVHTAVHLAYHLGQVDSHRRVVTGNGEGVGAVKPAELGSARKD